MYERRRNVVSRMGDASSMNNLADIPLINKINVGVELIAEGELIYLVASEDKEQKWDITPDAYAAVFHSMAAHAERLGGDCAIDFPGGTLQFKKRGR